MNDDDCGSPDCLVCVSLREKRNSKPVTIEDFSIDSVIALMEQDKNKLIERWGQKGFEVRLRLLRERK